MVTKRSPAPSPRLRTQSYQWPEGPPKLPDWSTVKLLRRVLHWGAAASAASGVGLTLFPSLIVHRFFEQNHANEYAWVRIAGIEAVGLGLLMVLVAHRIEELWWFSWAFVLTSGGIAVYSALKALFDVPADSSTILWWLIAGTTGGFAVALLVGLAMTGTERQAP